MLSNEKVLYQKFDLEVGSKRSKRLWRLTQKGSEEVRKEETREEDVHGRSSGAKERKEAKKAKGTADHQQTQQKEANAQEAV